MFQGKNHRISFRFAKFCFDGTFVAQNLSSFCLFVQHMFTQIYMNYENPMKSMKMAIIQRNLCESACIFHFVKIF